MKSLVFVRHRLGAESTEMTKYNPNLEESRTTLNVVVKQNGQELLQFNWMEDKTKNA